MKIHNEPAHGTQRRARPVGGAMALAAVFAMSLSQAAHAAEIKPPDVPDPLKVVDGSVVFLIGHARGTQNYVCLPSGSGFAFSLFTPEATLFAVDGSQLITHFFSRNPSDGRFLPTWQDSRDTSSFWGVGVATATSSTDPDFVDPNAIAWVLLDRAGVKAGPTGDRLTKTTHVQRVNTHGGLAPSTGCSGLADVGTKAIVLTRPTTSSISTLPPTVISSCAGFWENRTGVPSGSPSRPLVGSARRPPPRPRTAAVWLVWVSSGRDTLFRGEVGPSARSQ
jgi:hypothetical protein